MEPKTHRSLLADKRFRDVLAKLHVNLFEGQPMLRQARLVAESNSMFLLEQVEEEEQQVV